MRYNQGHLPGAVSIPVPMLKEQKEAVLPKDKDALIVFYCGGYT
jgi:rhodanese-related sulfurtransferase